MKKILIIMPGFSGGGAERVAADLTRVLAPECDCVLATNYVMPGMEYGYRGTLVNLELKPFPGFFLRCCQTVRAVKKIRALKRSGGFDASISFISEPNLYNLLSPGPGKLIISNHSYTSKEETGLLGLINAAIIRSLYNRADRVLAVSRGIAWDLAHNFGLDPAKCTVIPNSFDIGMIRSLAAEELDPGHQALFRQPVLISVGRFIEQKGQWHLLRIFRDLKVLSPGIKLVLLGDGRMRNYLVALSKELGLRTFTSWDGKEVDGSHDVYFLGFQGNPFRFIRCSRLLVLTSLCEGFGNVIVEALACGTPVVAADCPCGPREILAPGTDFSTRTAVPEQAPYGVLLPACSGRRLRAGAVLEKTEQIWVHHIAQLLTTPELIQHYAEQGPKRARDFEASAIKREWLDIV